MEESQLHDGVIGQILEWASIVLISILLLGGALGFADTGGRSERGPHHGDDSSKNAEETVLKGPDVVASSLVLNFEPNQVALSPQQKSDLQQMVNKANFVPADDQIEVAVWGDRKKAADAKEEKLLAKQRSDQIKTFLQEKYKVSRIEIFNMAEKSNWISRALSTDDAQLKNLFSKAETHPISRVDFDMIKTNGDASRAVVVIDRRSN